MAPSHPPRTPRSTDNPGASMANTASPNDLPSRASKLSTHTRKIRQMWENLRERFDKIVTKDEEFFTRPPHATNLNPETHNPGDLLRTRKCRYHLLGIPTPITATQILYVTTDVHGKLISNAASILHPFRLPRFATPSFQLPRFLRPNALRRNALQRKTHRSANSAQPNQHLPKPEIIAYQSFYDSTNPVDNPSRSVAGDRTIGGVFLAIETFMVLPQLLRGRPVVITDTQGETPQFAAGPGYGTTTLDALRCATRAPEVPVHPDSQIALLGYSGGSIATSWAAIQAADYAPKIARRLVGAAQGGLLVTPQNNLAYAGHGRFWAGATGLAVSSLAQTYDVDMREYLNDYGLAVAEDCAELSILETYGRYRDLVWSDIAAPGYPTIESIPEFDRICRELDMLSAPVPDVPLFIVQGAGGHFERTPAHPSLGEGDGIMVLADVRALVDKYRAEGVSVTYREYGWLSHFPASLPWFFESLYWVERWFRDAR